MCETKFVSVVTTASARIGTCRTRRAVARPGAARGAKATALILSAAAAALSVAGSARASTLQWNEAGGFTWSTSVQSWTDTTTPGGGNVVWADGNVASFTSTKSGTITVQAAGVSPSSTTFATGNAYTFVGGGINGSGGLTGTLGDTGAITFDNANGYSGATALAPSEVLSLATSSSSSTIAGSAANSNITVAPVGNGSTNEFFVDGTNLTGSGTITTTRGASLSLSNVSAEFIGSAGNATVENFTNNLTVGAGSSFLHLSPNSANSMTVGFGGAAETQGGVLTLQPTTGSYGTTAGANVANVILGSTSGLLTGNGSAGQADVGIVPWMVGGATSSDLGSSLITYDSTNGLRILTGSESSALAAGGTSGSAPNATVAATTNLGNNTTYVNSINYTTGGQIQMSGGTLYVQSGAILEGSGDTVSTTLGNSTGVGTVVFGTSSSSTVQGFIYQFGTGTGGNLSIYSTLVGSNGLTLTGNNATNLRADSSGTLTGTITINGDANNQYGVLMYSNGSLGAPSNPIVLDGRAELQIATNVTHTGTVSVYGGGALLDPNTHTLAITGDISVGTPTTALSRQSTQGGDLSIQGTNNNLGAFVAYAGYSDITPGGTTGGSGTTSASTLTIGYAPSGVPYVAQLVINGGVTTIGQLNANTVQTGSSPSIYKSSLILNAGTLNLAGSSVNLANPSDPGFSYSATNTATTTSTLVVGDGTHSAMLNLQAGTQIFTSGLTISGSGVLAGNTSTAVTGAIEVKGGGQVSPGQSSTPGSGIATLTLTNLMLDPNSILNYELTTPGGGAGSGDLIALTGSGTLSLGTGVGVNLSDSDGLSAGTYELLSYAGTDTVTGDPNLSSWYVLSGLPGGDSASFSDTGSQIDMTIATAVPEPNSAALLLLLVVGGLPLSRRLRRFHA